MTTRIERHAEMAEAMVNGHQSMTEAKVGGEEPVAAVAEGSSRKMIFYTPQYGEHEVDACMAMGGSGSLRELKMFWQRIPDFGVKSYDVFANEKGWAQVLYWSGTGDDGNTYSAEEVDVVHTDDEFNITRFEIYSDSTQWTKVVEYTNGKSVKDLPAYDKLLDQF